MIIDLPLILLCLTIFTGVVTLLDYFLRGRKKSKEPPLIVDYFLRGRKKSKELYGRG